MHEKISDVTILTIVVCTILLVILGGVIIWFLFAYQEKSHRHHQELIVLNETFSKTLLQSKLEIREQTLDHIAKELHANISQLVSIININLSSYIQQQGPDADENIIETKTLVKQLMAEIKALSITLNTEHVGKIGFQLMLKSELARLSKTGLFKIVFTKSGEECRLSSEKEIILFRLCQEVLNNVIKHAKARSIEVAVDYSGDRLHIRIQDDGIGFDPATVTNFSEHGSTGINNIYSRCKQIEGKVTIDSSMGHGTNIQVIVPYIL